MSRGTMYDEQANDQSIIRGEKHRLDTLRNRPLPISSHLQNEANGKTSVVKINFIWMRKKKKHFHNNGLALSLALK